MTIAFRQRILIVLHLLQLRLAPVLVAVVLFIAATALGAEVSYSTDVNQLTLTELANQERLSEGLAPLSEHPALVLAARAKASHMAQLGYFEHWSPDGRSPWSFIQEAGYDYRLAGENLAMDFQTSEGIHTAWMDSPTHRVNIMNPNYSDIGIAVVRGQIEGHETAAVVQMFGRRQPPVVETLDDFLNQVLELILGEAL